MTTSKVNVCADGGYLCDQCVIDERQRISEVDPECPDDDQWRIIGRREVNSSNGEICDHCSRKIYDIPISTDWIKN